MKKYYIKTFGCQMNYADSEKINMVLFQSGFIPTKDVNQADLILFNTCSVRQKGEDRVFGMMTDIIKNKKNNYPNPLYKRGNPNDPIYQWRNPIIGITGCMVRKTGMNAKYLGKDNERNRAKKIEYIKNDKGIYNNDDKLFPRAPDLDFTLRIEDISYFTKILSHIFSENIGLDHKFDDYMKSKQLRENPSSASVIIQKGCDNFCSFCIVPHTRDREISRSPEEIIIECREAVKSGAKEITLLGQNVNSYGKQFVDKKLWNEEKNNWNLPNFEEDRKLKIGIDFDDTIVESFPDEIFDIYNKRFGRNFKKEDYLVYNFNGDKDLEIVFWEYFYANNDNFTPYKGAIETIKRLKEEGHRLYIITSRGITEKEPTYTWIKKYFSKDFFEDIIFTSDYVEDKKCVIANNLGLDIVIEDAHHHIENYLGNTKTKIIIFDKPHNREATHDPDRTFRTYSWQEIGDIINSLHNTFKSPFRQLLEEVDKIDGLDRIRFTSSNPHDMTRDILDAHFDLDKTCNYLHLALQSGSNEMLKKMNRKHTYEEFRDIANYLRSRDPLFSISTDIIVGFSGETQEMFESTIQAIEEIGFDFLYIARYSVRPGTIASKIYPDDVSNEEKSKRWHIVNNLLKKSIQKRNSLMMNRVEEILVSSRKGNIFSGRTRNFKEVFFEDISKKINVGDLVKVRINEMDDWVLRGEVISG